MAGVNFHSKDGFDGIAVNHEIACSFENVDEFLRVHSRDTVVSYASREVRRLEIATDRIAYAKIIYALTDAGFQGRDWCSFLKWYMRPSRAIGIWHISQKLMEAGFMCAVPLLAARRRSSWGYPTDIIVTDEVKLPDLWQSSDSMDDTALVDILVRETVRLHQTGFAHGDYILRNVCLDTTKNQIVLLDNDRTWMVPHIVRNHYQFRNVAQMCYSLMRKFMNHTQARRFLEQYVAARKGVLSNKRAHDIFNACAKRAEKYLGPESVKFT